MYFVKSFILCQKRVQLHNLIITAVLFYSTEYRYQKGKLNMLSLDKTSENSAYKVIDVSLPESMRTRLAELGLIRGTVIFRTLTAPSGSPIAYLIRGAQIAIRSEHASRITVEKAEPYSF